MKLEKRWYSYIHFYLCFILLSILTVTLVVTVFDVRGIGSNISLENKWVDIIIKPVVATLFLAIVCGLLALFRHFRIVLLKNSKTKQNFRNFIAFVAFLGLLFAGFYFRYNLLASIALLEDDIFPLVRKFYNGQTMGVYNTLKYLYIYLIAFICKFTGIKEYIFLWVNLILDLLAAIIIFFANKRIFGRVAAIGCFALQMLLSAQYLQLLDTKGLLLIEFLIAVEYWFFSIYLKARFNRASKAGIHIIWIAVFGAIAGFIAYLDILGLVSFALMGLAVLIYRPKRVKEFTEENPEEQLAKFGDIIIYPEGVTDDDYVADSMWHKNTISLFLFVLFGLAAFGGMFYLDMISYPNWPTEYILFNNRYLQNVIGIFNNKFTLGRHYEELALLLMFATFGCLSFIRSKYDRISLPFYALLISVLLYTYTGRNDSMYLLIVPSLGILIGNCIDTLFFERFAVKNIFKDDGQVFEEKTIVDNMVDLDKVSLDKIPASKDYSSKNKNESSVTEEASVKKEIDITKADEDKKDSEVIRDDVNKDNDKAEESGTAKESEITEVSNPTEVITVDNEGDTSEVQETAEESDKESENTEVSIISEEVDTVEEKSLIEEVDAIEEKSLIEADNISEENLFDEENNNTAATNSSEEVIEDTNEGNNEDIQTDSSNPSLNSSAEAFTDDLVFENIIKMEENSMTKEFVSEGLSEDDIKTSVQENIERTGKAAFIENVLPTPKKHVKKEMDYAVEPTESEMKYDIEIPDDDDFDIRIY